jgi:hypothetical protein
MDGYDLLATDIQEKTLKEVKKCYLVFKKKWKQLAGAFHMLLLDVTIRLTYFPLMFRGCQNRTAYCGR